MPNPFELVIVCSDDLESDEDFNQLINNYHQASLASEMLIKGLISLEDFEDILDASGIDVEEYSEQVEQNVIALAY